MDQQELVTRVRKAINPAFTDWVLFANGTYIIFDDPVADRRAEALRLIDEFGPVEPGGPGGDFEVYHLDDGDGWVIGGHGYGMYTHVHPEELGEEEPSEVTVGLFGRSKRGQDAAERRIIYVNQE